MKKAKFAVGAKVLVSREPKSLVSDKVGEVKRVRVHPMGESYGYVYLLPGIGRDRMDVWIREDRLTKAGR